MKQTALYDHAQEQMKPGVITIDGFLGGDSRRLIDILDTDEAEVRRLGVTHRTIAARMRELRDAGERGLGNAVSVAPHFEVRVDGVRGKLPCPYEDGVVDKINTTVRNLTSGVELTFTDLSIHMIEHHGFYQGAGSRFRLEPATLVDVLEVPRTDA